MLVFAHWYCCTICQYGNIFLNLSTLVSYSNRQIVFNNKIGHENSSPISFKWSFFGTKVVVAVTKIRLCALAKICRFISASPWWAQLNSREKNTHKKFSWELEASVTVYLLRHLESNFALHACRIVLLSQLNDRVPF